MHFHEPLSASELWTLLSVQELKSKNIHIVGLSGAEGMATLAFLWQQGCQNITTHDFVEKEHFAKNLRLFHQTLSPKERKEKVDFFHSIPITKHFKPTYLEGIENADLVFASSGWFKHPANAPKLHQAYEKKIPFCTTIQLYLRYWQGTTIGVTGSNGKSTTAALIAHLLATAGKTVYLAGNAREGQQVLDSPDMNNPDAYLVLEISDRQLLAGVPASPPIAVYTNISPNHLDDHGTLERYLSVKHRLFAEQTPHDTTIFNADDPIVTASLADIPSPKAWFTASPVKEEHNTLHAYQDNEELIIAKGTHEHLRCPFSSMQLLGAHNRLNLQAAALAAYAAGIEQHSICKGLTSFSGLPHRIELVTTIDGIRLYDDIQSTTPTSTIAALSCFQEQQAKGHQLFLIAGGDDKGMDYTTLAQTITRQGISTILLPGSGSEKLSTQLDQAGTFQHTISPTTPFPLRKKVSSFSDALTSLRQHLSQGDIILVSPACAGFQSHFLAGKSVRRWGEEVLM